VIAVAFALTLSTAAHAATITVTSLADSSGTNICILRDAITAANTMTATNGCAAGSGNDTINFSVTGTITLGSTLPEIANVAPNSLTIDGTGQNITISGNNMVQVMQVASSTTLNLRNLTIAHGLGAFGGGIGNYTATLNLKGTILAASSGGNCSGSITDNGYNLSDDNSCGFSATGSHNNVTNLNLAPKGLQNNGGPTQTIALEAGSAAIDKIPVADCTDQSSPAKRITTDQPGALRPDVGELLCDIGAYEFQDLAGRPNCHGKSVSALAQQYGGLNAAASALSFPNVQALQNAITISCGG
jgi:hypothetical protein